MGERRYIPTNTLTHHKIMQQRANMEVKVSRPTLLVPLQDLRRTFWSTRPLLCQVPPDHLEVPRGLIQGPARPMVPMFVGYTPSRSRSFPFLSIGTTLPPMYSYPPLYISFAHIYIDRPRQTQTDRQTHETSTQTNDPPSRAEHPQTRHKARA